MKTIGILPSRMAASRFPGKPLHPICGRPMLEHCFRRAALFPRWDGLYLATCDEEIAGLGRDNDWRVVMTRSDHTRALDRVAEAAEKCGQDLDDSDVVVCVQGDEPMLHPDMIAASIAPLEKDDSVLCTVLAMEIIHEEQWRSTDTVKLIHDVNGDVLYNSRAPIPHCSGDFSAELGAQRIYGIFAFRWGFLKVFNSMPESPLELKESCDSNRILENGYKQRVAPFPYRPSFSVDRPEDARRVEEHMVNDPLWGQY